MKKLIMICAFVVLVATFSSTAKAVYVNPAEWDFSLVTGETYFGSRVGEDVEWGSLTNVETGWDEYDYEWQLTHISNLPPWPALEVANRRWVDMWGYMGPDDKSGSGTADGLPFVIFDRDFGTPGIIESLISAWVDEDGQGHMSVTDVSFGRVEYGANYYDVTGYRFGGDATVTGIPEPATAVLLVLGALGLIHIRRSK